MKQQEGVYRKYVLHFDINKTILLADAKYPELSKEECLMEILVGYAWGKLEQRDEKSPVLWKLAINSFQANNPGDGMISYKEYIDNQFPLKTAADDSNQERRSEYNKDVLNQRRQQYYSIVKQGSPCLKLKPEYDRIVKAITLPKAVIEELRVKMEEQTDVQSPKSIQRKSLSVLLQERDNLADLFSDGKFNIIPTFYKTIMNLKKQKKEFAIVFRPFGTDPKAILREFNKFCIGDHPCYSGRNNTPIVKFDGSKGTKNYIVQEKQSGIFYRYSQDPEQTQLAIGTLRRGDKKKSLEDEYEKEIEEEAVTLQKNVGSIYIQIMESLKESCGLCLQDDYLFYSQSQDEESAKLLFIDQTDYDTLHIFFDDNIHDSDKQNLVDVVDAITLQRVIRKKALNKYLVKVDIVEAIKDQDYFVKLIDQCEKMRAEEIERIEKGIPEDVPEVQKKSEFEILQESSDAEYLRRTVLPLLLPALQLVELERPSDPITFIAMYCLKNKEKVKIPQPTQEYLDSLNEQQEVADK